MPVWVAILKLAAMVLAKAAGEKLGETVAAELACKVAKKCPAKLEAISKTAKEKQAAQVELDKL